MTGKSEEVLPLIDNIVKGIFEKKGERVVKLDFRSMENSICDYFIICHGNSVTQVDSISESVELQVKKNSGEYPHHREGLDNCLWVLLDYGDVVVHIFQEEYRDFYNLEALWADAGIEELRDN
ncbi:MAG: ribosome silencing factor [Bacteroidales bacterium]|jgi:ribosome-associated protein|nr:ribosome silencing factor [Bacteroidales bacterium]